MQHGGLSDSPDFRANVYENVKGIQSNELTPGYGD